MQTRILGNGVYSLGEAAMLTGLRTARVGEWFRGRTAGPNAKPVFKSEYAPVRGDVAISFLDLVELFIAGQLREHGVSLQSLRRVHSCLEADWGTKHPFCRREIRTDGKRVFICQLDERERGEVTDVLTRQRVFETVLLPFLKKIDYDNVTSLARKWSVAPMVVIDPTIGFGKPVVEPVGISTKVLSAAYHANGREIAKVARWYDVNAKHVLAAVAFESRLVA